MTVALILTIVGVILLDQLTKLLTVTYLEPIGSFPIWKDVLHLTYVENEGAAFGMFADRRWVFMIVSTVAILGITVYLFGFCKEGKWAKFSLAMIVGGGIGNMIDRIALGYVVDFIDFTLINFAVFNVADSFVTVGACILAVYLITEIVKDGKKGKGNDPGEAS